MNKRLLITGVNGLLGQNLVKEFSEDHAITGLDLGPSLHQGDNLNVIQQDLTDGPALEALIRELSPDLIIHAAAYTNVDRAEIDEDIAYSVNSKVPAAISTLCSKIDIPLVHISTDYVFSGENGPYSENDACDPRGVYAQSKYAGELAVKESGSKHIIIRPNVLYGHGRELKSSFVDWLISELRNENEVRIVTDQYSNPTYARRLTQAIRNILQNEAWGTWHFGSKEVISRFDFAAEIADVFGLRRDLINAISTGELNQAAPRPMKCGLLCDKIVNNLGFPVLSIREELLLLKDEMNVA